MTLSREQLNRLAEALLYTADSASIAAERLGLGEIDESDLEDQLLSVNVERCPHCEWWCESAHIVLDEGEGVAIGCYSCLDGEREE